MRLDDHPALDLLPQLLPGSQMVEVAHPVLKSRSVPSLASGRKERLGCDAHRIHRIPGVFLLAPTLR
jgi:hypothetical protein